MQNSSNSAIAVVKKPTSRRNDHRGTWNGRIMQSEPTTTVVMNDAAPTSSPMARLPDPAFMAEKVEKRSGLPLPNARNVTPATVSSRPKTAAIVARFGQKKSEATMPRVEKRKNSQNARPVATAGRSGAVAQKYPRRYGMCNEVAWASHWSMTW